MSSTSNDCKTPPGPSSPAGIDPTPALLALPTIPDAFGNLTFVDGENLLPFSIKRAYFVTPIPEPAKRGGHAHRKTNELVVAVCGGFTVHLESPEGDDSRYRLDDPGTGLLVPALHWRVIDQYKPDSTCLVLASEHYDEDDYIRNYAIFRQQQIGNRSPR